MSESLRICTSRYQARELILDSGLAPVRITLGQPRFRLGYELAGEIRKLAPHHSILRLEGDEFAEAYRRQIGRHSPESLRAEMVAIAGRVGGPGVVLLCFEDVLAGEPCHRRVFAEWLEQRTGQAVPELG